MEEKKVIKKKVNESTLRNIIYKKVLEELNLKEFRDDYKLGVHDGDNVYVSPKGKTNHGTGLDFYHPDEKEAGARHTRNMRGAEDKLFSYKGRENSFAHGKGDLISKAIDSVRDILQISLPGEPSGKIEWTKNELDEINKAISSLRSVAYLTKQEGNKKRGYYGKEESEEGEQLSEEESEEGEQLSESKKRL